VATGQVDCDEQSATRRPAEPESYRVGRETYETLAGATPAERKEILLRLIEEHPQGRLELPARDGLHAVLDEIDLRPETLEFQGDRLAGSPWWDASLRAVCLRHADLRGASLRKANLGNACLENADFRDAQMGQARLQGAKLDGALLRGADMAGVDLANAALGGADLCGSMLEEANMQNASLRFAKLRGAILEQANLRRADLWGADLEGAILSKADLGGACLEETNLQRADLTGADLREAVLGRADLRAAVLRDARLQGVDLSHCEMAHVHLSGARLEETRFERDQLGGAIGEELAALPALARKGYLDAAVWAYQRRRRMQKRAALEQARSARAAGRLGQAFKFYLTYGSDLAVEWLCDYGESVPRVLGSLLVLFLFFSVLYGLTGSVVREMETPTGTVKVMTRNPLDLALFGLLAMTTGSVGIGVLPAHDLALLLVGLHLFLGVALIGLLGFVVGNRIRR
jgi:uncharacterized protein YjbI with pentapeptide repeats